MFTAEVFHDHCHLFNKILIIKFIVDEVGALVFDIGHYSIRAGYAGEDSPKAEIPSMVGAINEPIEAGLMDVDGQNPQRKFFLGTTSIHVPRKGMDMTTFLKDGMSMLFVLR